jgi:hypothetical protein
MFKNCALSCLFIILIISYPCKAKAKITDTLYSKPNKGLYSVSSISPDFCFITIKIRPDESGKRHNWEHYYINQKGNLGYRYAQMIGWQNNKHWGFEAGAELSRKIMTVDFATNEIIPEVRQKNQRIFPTFYRTVFNSINVPIRVVFTAGKKKLKFFTFFGINKTFCFNIYQEELTYNNNRIESNKLVTEDIGAKKVFSASDWAAGIKYNFTKKAALRVNGAVQRSYASVKSLNKKILFWSSGISLGYVYSW